MRKLGEWIELRKSLVGGHEPRLGSHVKHFIATHFYYENGGSIVTLTKKERLHYLAALDETVVKTDKPEDTTSQPVAAVLNLIK